MHRIDTEGNKNGKFYDGDPSGTDIKEATVLDANWLNAVQEEICSVIRADGSKLKKENHTQLLETIRKHLNPVVKTLNIIIDKLYTGEFEKLKEI